MLKWRIILFIVACALPAACGAHMMDPDYSDRSGSGMMKTIEESSMNATIHEEMEDLMEKMMAETLTLAEQDRLVQLMNHYPAGYSTMLDRVQIGYYEDQDMMGEEFWQGMPCYSMMGSIMPLAIILGGLFLVVWLIVGILAIIWLIGLVSKR